ncbi:MAG: SDR family oxidoreductase [Bacteriovoracaceae bacterium]|jgi:3-oxoacyl-[acyl-carrier protein] reductase|nr:SDR family oxidoreductase [Bacteriovoracaceae bacterium]
MEKIAVITGTSSGLGHQMALNLLDRGFTVYGGSRSSSEINHKNFIDIELDISNENSVRSFFKEVEKETEVVDVFINNAGICEMSLFSELNSAEFMSHMHINTMGTFYFYKYLEPFIISGESQIINVLSPSAKDTFLSNSSFCSSEAAKNSLIDVIKKEWQKYQVRFHNIYLGAVDTAIWDDYEDIEVEKMIHIDEFNYIFNILIESPVNLVFHDITVTHKDNIIRD